MNPFDFINSINDKTGNIMEVSPDVEKSYNSFIINKAFSYKADTLLHSNTMNGFPHLDRRLQYEYYYNSVKKGKRYSKWLKPESNQDEDLIMARYTVSRRRAKEYLNLISPEDLADIRKSMDIGGKR